jgi:hypothetical protein
VNDDTNKNQVKPLAQPSKVPAQLEAQGGKV